MMCMMYGHYLFKHWEEMMQVNKLVIKKFMLSEMSLTFLQVVSCIAQCQYIFQRSRQFLEQ